MASEELCPEQDLVRAQAEYLLRNHIPIQVKLDLCPVNNTGVGAPVMLTNNFSLTYFTVLADIEKSKAPSWLQVVDTKGLSVLITFGRQAQRRTCSEVVEQEQREGPF